MDTLAVPTQTFSLFTSSFLLILAFRRPRELACICRGASTPTSEFLFGAANGRQRVAGKTRRLSLFPDASAPQTGRRACTKRFLPARFAQKRSSRALRAAEPTARQPRNEAGRKNPAPLSLALGTAFRAPSRRQSPRRRRKTAAALAAPQVAPFFGFR